ncbi:DUF3800 domain-containing protein, partial [Candidatus Gracilibacteria bacterium]|nr:DUF3800 domain-containing protein [Candidatus Gracilibacteria bacterium]
MLYLFLDESGDLGFDFVQAKPSKYFVITIVAVEGMQNKKLLETAIKRTLKRKINARKNKTDELKARSTTLDVKKYAYKCTRDAQFSIYSLVVDKRSALQALAKDKSRIY